MGPSPLFESSPPHSVPFSPQLVQIQPEEGALSPGETVLFLLTFISSEHPTCYQFDVFCQVPNLNLTL